MTTSASKCTASCWSAAYLASRAPASMPAGPGSTVTRIEAVSSAPSSAICPTTLVVCSAEPSWSPWSTVTPTILVPDLRASKTHAASRASESAPPEHATRCVSPESARK